MTSPSSNTGSNSGLFMSNSTLGDQSLSWLYRTLESCPPLPSSLPMILVFSCSSTLILIRVWSRVNWMIMSLVLPSVKSILTFCQALCCAQNKMLKSCNHVISSYCMMHWDLLWTNKAPPFLTMSRYLCTSLFTSLLFLFVTLSCCLWTLPLILPLDYLSFAYSLNVIIDIIDPHW